MRAITQDLRLSKLIVRLQTKINTMTDPAGWDYPNPFTQTVTVRPEHIDDLDHVNNTCYVNWCQDIAWRHSEFLGLGVADYRELNRAMAIRHGEYDYAQAAYADDQLQIATWLTRDDGKLSMERCFQIIRVSDGVTVLRGRWEMVCIEISSGRPKRMPPVFVSTYGPAVTKIAG